VIAALHGGKVLLRTVNGYLDEITRITRHCERHFFNFLESYEHLAEALASFKHVIGLPKSDEKQLAAPERESCRSRTARSG
jgi:hypothetical protein